VSGESIQEMSDFSSNILKPRLESLPEVREVALTGLEEKEIIVKLKSEKLIGFGIQQEDVIHTIQQNNVNESIGEFENDKDSTIRWNTTLETADDIKEIQLQTSEGLKSITDIADVEEETSEQAQLAWKNGNPDFIIVQIGRSNGATQIDMTEAVRAEVEAIKQEELQDNIKIEDIKSITDIADVEEETSEQAQLAWKNGTPDFILVQIGRTNGATQIDMTEAVRAEDEAIKQEDLQDNLKIEEIAAQADYVSNAI